MASRVVTTEAELEALYGAVNESSTVKEVAVITPHYRRLIEASPFAVLATMASPSFVTNERCCCPTGAATTASILCATSCATRAWPR
jgi:predicted pyridoxine 5'-phosphate oxidase superfamily flavin-nucleotide-binding protein